MIMLSTTQYAEYLEYREQERERERVAHLPNTQVINPRGDNTRLYTFPKFDYLGQIQVPSQEIWIFSLRNVPACLMNCSQNYILHVCFHLNLKHVNTRQLTRPLNSSHIEPIQITTRTPNCQYYCSQNGQKHKKKNYKPASKELVQLYQLWYRHVKMMCHMWVPSS